MTTGRTYPGVFGIMTDMSNAKTGLMPGAPSWLAWLDTADNGLRLLTVAVLSLAVYTALFAAADLAGLGLALAADSQDPFDFAAEKVKGVSTGFMLLVRVGMAVVIVCICIYAWWKGGKVSPAWIAVILVSGFIAVRADLVVNMFGSTNPISNIN